MDNIFFWKILLIGLTLHTAPSWQLGLIKGVENVPRSIDNFIVSLQFLEKHFCAGAILNERHIITSAHCGLPISFDKLLKLNATSILTGTKSLSEGGVRYEIEEIVYHPDLNIKNVMEKISQKSFDWPNIALVKVKNPIKYDEFTEHFNLYAEEEPNEEFIHLFGWGMSESVKAPESLEVQSTETVSNEGCQERFYRAPLPLQEFKIGPGNICDGTNYKQENLYHSDLGGILTFKSGIVGVTIWKEANSTMPGIFTRITPYVNWINETISSSEKCVCPVTN